MLPLDDLNLKAAMRGVFSISTRIVWFLEYYIFSVNY